MNGRRLFQAVVIVLVVCVMGVAASSIVVSNDLPLQTNTGFTVTLDDVGTFPGTSSFVGNDTIQVASGSVTAQSGGQLNVTDSDLTGDTELTNINVTGTTAEIDPTDKPQFDITGGVDSVTVGTGVSVTDSNADFTYSASGSFDLTLRQLKANADLGVVSSSGTILANATTDGNGNATFSLPARSSTDVILFENDAPAVTESSADPADGAELQSDQQTYEIDVSDPNFAPPEADEVNASLYIDGSYRGSDTLTAAGTASVSASGLTGGDHTYHWELADAYGGTASSQTKNISVPSNVTIFEETDPDDVVAGPNATITARFFREGSEVVIERQTTTGTVSLDGLDPDQEYILVVRVDGFQDRRVILESLYEQTSVYVLNNSVSSSEIFYELRDNTGEFPAATTRLLIEKPIHDNSTNQTRFQVITGDTFGASATFPATLETDRRYRLRVVNKENDTRVLGDYTVTGDASETLPLGNVILRGSSEEGEAFAAQLDDSAGGRVIRAQYRDPKETTDRIDITIVQYGNESNVLVDNQTINGPFGTATATYNVPNTAPDDISYRVQYTAIRSAGANDSGEVLVGDVPPIAQNLGLAPGVLSLLGWATIILVTGLVTIVSAPLATIVAVLVATLMTFIGAVAIPFPLLGVAGGIAFLANAGRLTQ
jgi:hypothetical protein